MARRSDLIVGVDLGGTSLRSMVVDAKNKILAVVKTPTKASGGAAQVIAEIADAVKETVKAAGVNRREIAVVCGLLLRGPQTLCRRHAEIFRDL